MAVQIQKWTKQDAEKYGVGHACDRCGNTPDLVIMGSTSDIENYKTRGIFLCNEDANWVALDLHDRVWKRGE